MTDRVELQTRLIETAINQLRAKRDAELAGRPQDADYHDRQYQQAIEGFDSLGGTA